MVSIVYTCNLTVLACAYMANFVGLSGLGLVTVYNTILLVANHTKLAQHM